MCLKMPHKWDSKEVKICSKSVNAFFWVKMDTNEHKRVQAGRPKQTQMEGNGLKWEREGTMTRERLEREERMGKRTEMAICSHRVMWNQSILFCARLNQFVLSPQKNILYNPFMPLFRPFSPEIPSQSTRPS
jgi:hypothetical protein